MITKEEQIQLFYDKYSIDLLDLIQDINKICEDNNLPILNNKSQNFQQDFIDLILENINLKKLYINNYKLFK